MIGASLGASLGAYKIGLVAGGMVTVYAATGPDGVVALKVVHPHLLETPVLLRRFMRDAQLGRSTRHENVVRTLDCGRDVSGSKPPCFLVMEYVEGQSLGDLLGELERVAAGRPGASLCVKSRAESTNATDVRSSSGSNM